MLWPSCRDPHEPFQPFQPFQPFHLQSSLGALVAVPVSSGGHVLLYVHVRL